MLFGSSTRKRNDDIGTRMTMLVSEIDKEILKIGGEIKMANKVTVELELDATKFDEQLAQRTKALEEYKRLKDEIGAASLSCDFGNSDDVSVVVMSYDGYLSSEATHRISEMLKRVFPNAQVLVLENRMTMQLLRRGDRGSNP
jgi:DNA-binding transcriptional ArsR family regulator